MTTTSSMNGHGPSKAPDALRLLGTPSAAILAALNATFEDLQTVLRCCERLVAALAEETTEPDDILVEGVWTTALLSYGRCFSGDGGAALTEDDLESTKSHEEALKWHRILRQLRDQYADPAANPRERFSVGVAQGADGAADGVAITSARQPLVDDLTVRQTGAIAFALSGLVNDRIAAQQAKVYDEVKGLGKAELDRLERIEVATAE